MDFATVPFVDSTAANTIEALARKMKRRRVAMVLTGTSRDLRRELLAHGIKPPLVQYAQNIEDGLGKLHRLLSAPTGEPAV